MKIKSPKDFWAGLMFMVFGLFFLGWGATHYQMGTAVRMGPAYFPVVLGGLQAVLGLLAIFAVIFVIVAGIRLIVSGGEDEQKQKAKNTVIQVIIGLIVILLARVIVDFVINTL